MKRAVLLSLSVAGAAFLASWRWPSSLQPTDFVGEWQFDSKVLGSNKRNAYVCRANRTFVYTTDGQDALIEVLSIRGTYALRQDTLFVRPRAMTKRIGGRLIKNVETPVNDMWEMYGGTIKTLPLTDPTQYPMIIRVISKHKILEIDGSLYYKI